MKKTPQSIIAIFFVSLIIPNLVFASWWNPFSWFKKNTSSEQTEVLEKRIKELEAKLAGTIDGQKVDNGQIKQNSEIIKNTDIVKTQEQIEKEINDRVQAELRAKQAQEILIAKQKAEQQSENTPVVKPPILSNVNYSRPLKVGGGIDLSKYNELYVLDYLENPKASLGKPVKIMRGTIVDFNQGNNNYIIIADNNDTSSNLKTINFLVESDNDYTLITNELKKWDDVLIYGFGEENRKFNIVGNGGSYESYEPVISVDAIYKCKTSDCRFIYSMGVDKIFLKEL